MLMRMYAIKIGDNSSIRGDYTDPFGYLAKMGVSRQQFVKDVANEISRGGSTVKVRDDYYSEGSYFEAL
ncbi:hypothetical protein [Vagococcus vulneris]|nr:hypothetical protein [Vagococcus vulneris]